MAVLLQASDLPDPEIDVVRHGRLKYPLTAEDVAKLKQVSAPSDADTNVWVIEASKIAVRNKAWKMKAVTESCLKATRKHFGLSGKINARPINMTIYGKGSRQSFVPDSRPVLLASSFRWFCHSSALVGGPRSHTMSVSTTTIQRKTRRTSL